MSFFGVKEPTHFDADPALIQEDMEVMSDFELHNLCLQYPSLNSHKLKADLLLDSGKFSLLTQLLASLKEKVPPVRQQGLYGCLKSMKMLGLSRFEQYLDFGHNT